MISMSDMCSPSLSFSVADILTFDMIPRRRNITLGSGIQILKRSTSQIRTGTYELHHLVPMDSRVEIDAKITVGCFTSGEQISGRGLSKPVGKRQVTSVVWWCLYLEQHLRVTK